MTKSVLATLAMVLNIACCAFDMSCGAASARPVKALVLKQQSDAYGAITSTVSSGALRIDLSGRKIYLVALAPTWRVMLCNDESKEALGMALSQWLAHSPQFNYMGGDWNRFGLGVSPLAPGQFKGLPCNNYIFPAVGSKSAKPGKGSNKYRGCYSVLAPQAGGVDLASGPVCAIVQRALSCPEISGFPLAFTAKSEQIPVEGYKLNLGGDSHWLATSAVERREVDDKIFAYPSGYKSCAREIDVLKDAKHDAAVNSMFNDLIK